MTVRSAATRPLPLRIAVETHCVFLILYAEWLIQIPRVSLGGSCKHTTRALRLTPVSSAATVHSYDHAQLCLITLIICSQVSHWGFSHSRGHDLCLGHHDISRLLRCLLFLRISQLFPSAICCPSSPGSMTKHHSIRPRCLVCSFTHGGPSCCPRLSAVPRCFGGFTLLRAPATERYMISFAIGALLLPVAAE